ncbi:MAG: sigma-70 family RNA polymerase sigma factor [Acidimicrobiia bacterium]|nr:sigma-70 family RNA polymerase sigma factor [Acidimicrobiia bacterium]
MAPALHSRRPASYDRHVNSPDATALAGTRSRHDLEAEVESHRRELTAYCYRMLGSNLEADDAVQDTMVRAWRSLDGFEGRSSLRSWLYRIATNVCIDMTRGPQRRARPMDLSPASTADSYLAPGLPEETWITPVQDLRVVPVDGDPAEVAAGRESIRLAFVAALQHLPARQRATLILCEVLKWQATEVAELLDTTVASVNSALQRARATLATVDLDGPAPGLGADDTDLLARYVDAFERYDVPSLVALLRDDVKFNMPPYPLWLLGADQVAAWLAGPGIGCANGKILPAGFANGCPAFGSYRIDPAGGYSPWSFIVLEIDDGQIVGWNNFLGPAQFAAFGLPPHLD